MKKMVAVLLAVAALLTAAGCQSKKDGPFKDVTMEDLLNDIYENVEMEMPALQQTQITDENLAWYLGMDQLDYQEAIASEPMMSAIAYSVCLVRMKEGADIEAAKQAIQSGIDPRKWVCVGVDPANVIVDSAGDVIILIMSNDYATALHDSFTSLAGK